MSILPRANLYLILEYRIHIYTKLREKAMHQEEHGNIATTHAKFGSYLPIWQFLA